MDHNSLRAAPVPACLVVSCFSVRCVPGTLVFVTYVFIGMVSAIAYIDNELMEGVLMYINAVGKIVEEVFQMLQKPCDNNIVKAIELADQMILLAQKGDGEREDSGCGILYGVLLDSGFKLRTLAIEEMIVHKRKGWWKECDRDDERV